MPIGRVTFAFEKVRNITGLLWVSEAAELIRKLKLNNGCYVCFKVKLSIADVANYRIVTVYITRGHSSVVSTTYSHNTVAWTVVLSTVQQ